jgi:hypothetical protein
MVVCGSVGGARTHPVCSAVRGPSVRAPGAGQERAKLTGQRGDVRQLVTGWAAQQVKGSPLRNYTVAEMILLFYLLISVIYLKKRLYPFQ